MLLHCPKDADRIEATRLGGKRSVARNTLALLVANGLSSVLGLVRGFYVARVLLPADYGVWSLISALLTYANYADAGINTGFILEVPKLIGERRVDEAQRVQKQAYTATIVVCGVGALVVVLISFLPLQFNSLQIFSIRIVSAAIFVLALLNYYLVVARIQDRFGLIGLATFITAVVATAGVMAVGVILHRLSVEAVALTSVLGSCTAVLLLGLATRPPLDWKLDRGSLCRLIVIGLPVSLLPIVLTLFQSIDRWVVASLVPANAMGFYGLGATLGLFLYMIPNTLAIVLFTRQIERYGATGNPKASEALVLPPLLFSGYIMALVAGEVTLAMPFIIHYIAPAYAPGTRAAIFQVIGNCLLFGVPVAANFLISAGRQRQVFGALIICMLVEAGLVATLVQTSWGIDGAALAVLISDAALGGLVAFLAVHLFGSTLLAQLGRVASYFLPFAVCIPGAVWLLKTELLSGALWDDLGRLAMRSTVYVLILGPLCLLIAWVTGALRQLAVARWLPRVILVRLASLKVNGRSSTTSGEK